MSVSGGMLQKLKFEIDNTTTTRVFMKVTLEFREIQNFV
jgi:hypothetical protein